MTPQQFLLEVVAQIRVDLRSIKHFLLSFDWIARWYLRRTVLKLFEPEMDRMVKELMEQANAK